MSSTPMTPGSVDGIHSPSSSPPSSPPSAHEADMEYHEPKAASKGEQQQNGPLIQLEHYLNVTQNFSSELMKSLKQALDARDSETLTQPKLVTGGTLKEYQLEGLTWLTCLYATGLSGLLADEMGLGKTIQVIAFVAWLQENGISGPILILGPLSTVSNWVNEFQQWAPKIPVVMYRGNPQERMKLRSEKMKINPKGGSFPVICTSYQICMNDKKFLSKYRWKYLIVDEGHRLKNFNCELVKQLREYDMESRLILTGTPLQNNLAELWSLLNFLLPDAFGDLEQFERMFNISDNKAKTKDAQKSVISAEYRAQTIASLHAILKPFLLRRVKADVELTLPKKREYLLYAPLTMQQRELYRKVQNKEIRQHLEEKAIERMGGQVHNLTVENLKRKADSGTSTPNKSVKSSRSSTPASSRPTRSGRKDYAEVSDTQYFKDMENEASEPTPQSSDNDEEADLATIRASARREVAHKALQNPIMQLRLVCNSPLNFSWPWKPDEDPDTTLITSSGKMILLDRLVPALLARGHKILIFSQFQTQLDILEDWAQILHSWPVCRIDGSVTATDREEAISTFNSDDDVRICLVTTRAGGQGINLTAADTVILFDSDWNPQQDLQAQDRAHRIGQTRPVIVYRLATKGTVEQILLEKADGKRRLERLVIQKDKFRSIVGKTRKTERIEGDDVEQLQRIMDEEDDFAYEPEAGEEGVLSERDLERLTDRSDEAYAKELEGKGEASSRFKAFERKGDEGGLLGDMGK